MKVIELRGMSTGSPSEVRAWRIGETVAQSRTISCRKIIDFAFVLAQLIIA